MKKLLITTVLLSVSLGAMPGYAACPPGQDVKKAMPMKKSVLLKTERAVPVQQPFWHDLHWFE